MHFSLIVIGNGDIEDMMEPFYQDLVVPEYCEGEVTEQEKQHFLDFYNERAKGRHYSMQDLEELYAEKGEDWNFNRWRKDDDGVWREYSTSNPDMKWDWYEIGGRWPGKLELKEGAEPIEGLHFSWGWSVESREEFMKKYPRNCDCAYKGDIANLDTLTCYSILKDGEWIDIDGKVSDYLDDVDDDTILTCIDYHM